MRGEVSFNHPPLTLWTGIMVGGRGNLILTLLLPMPQLVYELLDTQILSAVAFRDMYDPVSFDDSEPDAVEGCKMATMAPLYLSPLWFFLRLRQQ